MDATGNITTTAEEDFAVEAAVLQQVLALHPTPVTPEELVREMTGGAEDFTQRDAISRAVGSLAGAGLLHRSAGMLFASRGALRCSELLDR